MAENTSNKTYNFTWNGMAHTFYPHMMEHNDVIHFIVKHNGRFAVLRAASADAKNEAKEQGIYGVVAVMSYLNNDNEVDHVYITEDTMEWNDLYDLAKKSGANEFLEKVIIEQSRFNNPNSNNNYRGGRIKRRSRTKKHRVRRAKKSKSRSRK